MFFIEGDEYFIAGRDFNGFLHSLRQSGKGWEVIRLAP